MAWSIPCCSRSCCCRSSGCAILLKMLPLLFWEVTWKATWLLAVALPAWQDHTMDADTWDTTFACLISVIFLFIMPWDYVWRKFVTGRGDRWW